MRTSGMNHQASFFNKWSSFTSGMTGEGVFDDWYLFVEMHRKEHPMYE